MNVLMLYQVSSREDEVKRELQTKGYFDGWSANNKVYDLPKCSIWKPNIEFKNALADIREIIGQLNLRRSGGQPEIQLEKCITVSVSPWDGIPRN